MRQYRHGAGKVLLKLPSDLLSRARDPEAGAARELLENRDISRPAGKFLFRDCVECHQLYQLYLVHLARDGQLVSEQHLDETGIAGGWLKWNDDVETPSEGRQDLSKLCMWRRCLCNGVEGRCEGVRGLLVHIAPAIPQTAPANLAVGPAPPWVIRRYTFCCGYQALYARAVLHVPTSPFRLHHKAGAVSNLLQPIQAFIFLIGFQISTYYPL